MEPQPSASVESSKSWICLRCESVGSPATPGLAVALAIAMAVIAAMVAANESVALGGLAFAVAAIPVALARTPPRQCARCGSNEVIPTSSPRARRAGQ